MPQLLDKLTGKHLRVIAVQNDTSKEPWTDDENAALVKLANEYPLWTVVDIATRFAEDHYPDSRELSRKTSECLEQLEHLRSRNAGRRNENARLTSDSLWSRTPSNSRFLGGALNKLYDIGILQSQDPAGDLEIDELHATICRPCQTFSSRYLAEGLGVNYHGMKHPANESVDKLKESALRCTCCKFIYNNLDMLQVNLVDSNESRQLMISNTNYNIGIYLKDRDHRHRLACFTLVHLDDWRPLDGRHIDLSFVKTITQEQNFIRRTIGKASAGSISFDSQVEQISKWLNTCSRHLECKRRQTKSLPDRVVNLGLENQALVYLQEQPHTQNSHPYVALSYCWGTHGQYLLTDASRATLKAGVAVSNLPKTVQDAIKIARALGYLYLWIDALCIVQGSAEDWQQQSSKMASIYGNAHLTLIASNAGGVTEGFIGPRSSSETYCGYHTYKGRKKPLYLSHPFAGFNGYPAWGKLGDSQLDDERDWRAELENNETAVPFVVNEPLTCRGWTAQERKLSPRKVYFGTKQMFWECQTSLFLENGYRVRDRGEAPIKISPVSSYSQWVRAVEVYSGCKLTKITDRLPAMSGLASEFSEKHRDEYLAGHFYSRLMTTSLIWEPVRQEKWGTESIYLAPSWSWASRGLAIQYPYVEGVLWSIESVSKVLAHSVLVKGQNRFGEVSSGWLEIQAPVFWTHVGRLPENMITDSDGRKESELDHARRTLKHRLMALDLDVERRSASEHGATTTLSIHTTFTLDWTDLQTDALVYFVILSCRTNATRRRDLQVLQPVNSYIRNSTFSGVIVMPSTSEMETGQKTFWRIGVFYDMDVLQLQDTDYMEMRLI